MTTSSSVFRTNPKPDREDTKYQYSCEEMECEKDKSKKGVVSVSEIVLGTAHHMPDCFICCTLCLRLFPHVPLWNHAFLTCDCENV